VGNRITCVAAEIVHHDDVSQPSRRHQELLDVGAKADRGDRLIEQAWCADAVASQGGDEGQGLAVAMRHLGDQSLTDGHRPRIGVMFVFA
jgi:hypothetical protein